MSKKYLAHKSEVYTKIETDNKITDKIAEVVANAPEDFDTLKEISDWITSHKDSAAAMNSAIQQNTIDISSNTTSISNLQDQVNNKVGKETGKGLSTNDFTNEDKNKLDSLENYDDTAIKNDIALNLSSIGMSKKNLLDTTCNNQTTQGISYTSNSDKSISVSGTNTYTGWANIYFKSIKLNPGRYILSGCPTGGGDYRLRLGEGTESNSTYIGVDKGSGFTFEVDTTSEFIVSIQTAANYSYPSSVIFKPMIRYADITDDTYEPYTEDLQTQIKNNIALNLSGIGISKKNLLKNTAVTKVKNGITFTVNDDGSILANGTATNNTDFPIGDFKTKNGLKYILSGCPQGGTTTTYRLNMRHEGQTTNVFPDTGDGVTFTGIDETMSAIVLIYSGTTVDNLTFYPMIRYADITDGTYEPYREDLQTQINNSNQKIEFITGISRKNLCNITYTSRKVNTVNVTVNSDKTITLLSDNTPTINIIEILTPLIELDPYTTYILSGGISSNIRMELRDGNKNPIAFDSGSGTEYTPGTTKTCYVYVAFRIQSGTNINPSVTLSPMLRIKDTDNNNTYEPYHDDLQTQINNIVARLTTLEGGA